MRKLEEMIIKVDRRMRQSKFNDKRKVRICAKKTGYQYYLEGDDSPRTYVKKENLATVQAIVQHEYDERVMKELRNTKYHIDRFLCQYDMDAIENVYNKLCDARKVLVTPIIETDEDFIQSWKQQHIGQQNDYPTASTFLTEQGEKVRSKSEKILADLFLKYGIPYTYEPQLCLENGKYFYPDFALLNIRTRKTIYWEHFGLITDGTYASKAMQKIHAYDEGGLIVGENLLFSMESEEIPLDVRRVEEKIEKYLL
ncbi:MAG: hypothetical protein K6A05_04540 [Lachnospiraceae bacterium]|nr:hypothetical protein [Lachnospiraceae bacterium]